MTKNKKLIYLLIINILLENKNILLENKNSKKETIITKKAIIAITISSIVLGALIYKLYFKNDQKNTIIKSTEKIIQVNDADGNLKTFIPTEYKQVNFNIYNKNNEKDTIENQTEKKETADPETKKPDETDSSSKDTLENTVEPLIPENEYLNNQEKTNNTQDTSNKIKKKTDNFDTIETQTEKKEMADPETKKPNETDSSSKDTPENTVGPLIPENEYLNNQEKINNTQETSNKIKKETDSSDTIENQTEKKETADPETKKPIKQVVHRKTHPEIFNEILLQKKKYEDEDCIL